MATRIQITLTADSLSETMTQEFQDEFRRFTALHDAAPDLLSSVKRFFALQRSALVWRTASDAEHVLTQDATAVIAKAEGRS